MLGVFVLATTFLKKGRLGLYTNFSKPIRNRITKRLQSSIEIQLKSIHEYPTHPKLPSTFGLRTVSSMLRMRVAASVAA